MAVDKFGDCGGGGGKQGPIGPTGPQGKRGAPGPIGPPGTKGSRGEKGQIGSKGETGSQGPAGEEGPQGPKGNDGFDISKWLPEFTLKQFRMDEELTCLLITDPENDLELKNGNYMRWIARSKTKKDAIAIQPSKSCKKIKEGVWGLNFPALYKIEDVYLTADNCVLISITFQIEQKKDEQFIINDSDGEEGGNFRGISVTNDAIRIYGVDNKSNYISIPYSISKDSWTTILVEYLSEQYQRQGSYIINKGKKGTFTCNELPMVSADVSYIGGLQNRQHPMLTGSISAIDCFEKEEKAPDRIKDMIMKGQEIMTKSWYLRTL